MSPPETGLSDEQTNDPTNAFIGTLVFFALVGPPAGLLAIVVFLITKQLYHIAWSNIEFYLLHTCPSSVIVGGNCVFLKNSLVLFFPQNTLLIFMGSYFVGLIPAIFAGLAIAIGMSKLTIFRFWHALAIGTVIGLLLAALASLRDHSWVPQQEVYQGNAGIIYICVFATCFCWLLSSQWWPRKQPVTNGEPR
jgi:hypothetical protein